MLTGEMQEIVQMMDWQASKWLYICTLNVDDRAGRPSSNSLSKSRRHRCRPFTP